MFYDPLPTLTPILISHCNAKQKPFFDACDGIFVNYTWAESAPSVSAAAAAHRRYDVYMGVDVFGRGTYGGGGMACAAAAQVALRAGTSLALFAPGWV